MKIFPDFDLIFDTFFVPTFWVQVSGVSCQLNRQQRWIYHYKKLVISDESSGSKGSGVGVEPRKLNDGIAAPVWSLNIGI